MKFKLNKLLIAKLGISHVINSRLMYNNLKNNNYAKERTTLLGTRALRHILFFALFTTIAIICFKAMINYFVTAQIIMSVLMLIFGIYTVAYGILYLPLALNLTIKQLRLNKKFVGWLDLVLLLIAFIAVILLILFLKFS